MIVIITVCALLMLAYIFDLTSSFTKIPSVILLLFLGWAAQIATKVLNIEVPNLEDLLPIFGTIGLILIVLDGSLDVVINRSKFTLIRKSLLSALFPLVGLSILLAFVFQYYGGFTFKDSLINAIPLCIISSAIAIPSVKYLSQANKEFVTYESSLSDIFGVIFFDFIALNAVISMGSFTSFFWQFLIMVLVSFVATVALAFLLSKIDHHIKFVPIIILIIIIYAVAKMYHLPALIFILLFGLFLGNLEELQKFRFIRKSKPEELNRDVMKFKEIVIEGTFLIRTMFFLLFGFLISTREIINLDTLPWAVGIVALIFLFRYVQLKVSKIPLKPLWLIAPRGLITILLFLAVAPESRIDLVNNSLIIQVILLTAISMMIGLMTTKSVKKAKTDEPEMELPKENVAQIIESHQ